VIQPGQLANVGSEAIRKYTEAVAPVGMAVAVEGQPMSAIACMFAVVGGARLFLGGFQPELRGVVAKGLDPPLGVVAERRARRLRARNRLVVDVREVHHLTHLEATHVAERTAQHIQTHERAEIADVPAPVHGEAAHVHADGCRPAAARTAPRHGSACCTD
jgi:hypothetical protein